MDPILRWRDRSYRTAGILRRRNAPQKSTAEFFGKIISAAEGFRRRGESDYAAAAYLRRRRRVNAQARLSLMAVRYSGGAEGGQAGLPTLQCRSPDGAKRNPGPLSRIARRCAALHPGYQWPALRSPSRAA